MTNLRSENEHWTAVAVLAWIWRRDKSIVDEVLSQSFGITGLNALMAHDELVSGVRDEITLNDLEAEFLGKFAEGQISVFGRREGAEVHTLTSPSILSTLVEPIAVPNQRKTKNQPASIDMVVDGVTWHDIYCRRHEIFSIWPDPNLKRRSKPGRPKNSGAYHDEPLLAEMRVLLEKRAVTSVAQAARRVARNGKGAQYSIGRNSRRTLRSLIRSRSFCRLGLRLEEAPLSIQKLHLRLNQPIALICNISFPLHMSEFEVENRCRDLRDHLRHVDRHGHESERL